MISARSRRQPSNGNRRTRISGTSLLDPSPHGCGEGISYKTMAIKLIIFDLDGTLVDSLGDLTTATNHMLAAFARPQLSPDQVRRLVGEGARRLVERALGNAADAEIERGLELFLAYNDAHIADKTRLYPGVKETLPLLGGSGRRLAVISNKNVSLCRKLLALLGVEGHFAAVMGADSLPFRKPSPEPVLQMLRNLGVAEAEAAIVGDSINDIAAGRGAGIVTVGCGYGYGEAMETAQADYLVHAFADLLELPLFKKN